MIRPLVLFAAATVAVVAVAAGNNPTAWRDVLETPATRSTFAPRALLNGLAPAGNSLVAVGQRGHVLYTADKGSTWQQATVPVSSDLVAVHFPTPTTGWTVGHDGVVLRSTDSGATWTRQLDGNGVGAAMTAYYARNAAPAGADAKRVEAATAEAKRFAEQGNDIPLLDVWFENEKYRLRRRRLRPDPAARATAARAGSRGCTPSTIRRGCTCIRCARSAPTST